MLTVLPAPIVEQIAAEYNLAVTGKSEDKRSLTSSRHLTREVVVVV